MDDENPYRHDPVANGDDQDDEMEEPVQLSVPDCVCGHCPWDKMAGPCCQGDEKAKTLCEGMPA